MSAPEETRRQGKFDLDWSSADPEMAKVILKQGELRLDAQLRIALAADQRAMVSAGICAAFAAAVTTATIANFSQFKAVDTAMAGAVTAATLLVAAGMFLRCARPVKFKPPGNEPKEWFSVRDDDTLAIALGGECENYQQWIDENNKTLTENAHRYWIGVKLAVAAPVIGGITFLAPHLPFHLPWILVSLRLL